MINILTGIIVPIVSIFNLYVIYKVYELDRKKYYSKLSIDPIFKKTEKFYHEKDREIYYNNDESKDFQKKGFPSVEHTPFEWSLTIKNRGDLPSTNIILNYTIIIKRKEFDYGIDMLDIKNERLVEYKRIHHTKKIPYMGADAEKKIHVLNVYGEFPSADLILEELRSDESEFITKSTKIDEYNHPDFERLQDSNHHREMLGLYY